MSAEIPPEFKKDYSGSFTSEELSVNWDIIQNSFLEPEEGFGLLERIKSFFKKNKVELKLHYELKESWKGDITIEYPTAGQNSKFDTIMEDVGFEDYKKMITGVENSENPHPQLTPKKYIHLVEEKYSPEEWK